MKQKVIIFICAVVAFTACISDFTPDVKGVSGILVVDGTITGGESTFKLSRSISILDSLQGDNWIDNAVLSVECSDGTLFPANYEGDGLYRVTNGDLHPDKEYRLNFSIDGTQYLSTFLQPMQTVEIDSLSWDKAGIGKPITIHVSAHDDNNSTPYYRWEYEETWEVQAPLFAYQAVFDGKFLDCSLASPINTYYCWGRDSTKMLLIGSTKELTSNIVPERKLFEFPCSDERISHLYHIRVSQMQIREEAYNYFRVLQDEIERTGGLFSPVMSAGDNGNIYNQSDSSEPIVGYIEVTNRTYDSMYIEPDLHFGLYESEEKSCWIQEFTGSGATPFSHPWVDYKERLYTYPRCVDCRTHNNASKRRPTWWPNNHQ